MTDQNLNIVSKTLWDETACFYCNDNTCSHLFISKDRVKIETDNLGSSYYTCPMCDSIFIKRFLKKDLECKFFSSYPKLYEPLLSNLQCCIDDYTQLNLVSYSHFISQIQKFWQNNKNFDVITVFTPIVFEYGLKNCTFFFDTGKDSVLYETAKDAVDNVLYFLKSFDLLKIDPRDNQENYKNIIDNIVNSWKE